jgi:hypothetical protein
MWAMVHDLDPITEGKLHGLDMAIDFELLTPASNFASLQIFQK